MRTASSFAWSSTPTTRERRFARCRPNAAALRARWADPANRRELIEALEQRGINFDELAEAAKHPDATPSILLCHLAFQGAAAHAPGAWPIRLRRERRDSRPVRRGARQVLEDSAEKYAVYGTAQFVIPGRAEGAAAQRSRPAL